MNDRDSGEDRAGTTGEVQDMGQRARQTDRGTTGNKHEGEETNEPESGGRGQAQHSTDGLLSHLARRGGTGR